MRDDDWDLFSWSHARASDPDTSHEAVPINLSEQAYRVLQAYIKVDYPILDHTAYVLVGFGHKDMRAHQRCSDLRHGGFIERCGRGVTPSGKSGYLCRITPRGRAYLVHGPSAPPLLPLLAGAMAEVGE